MTDTVIPGDRHGYIRGQTCRQCALMQFDVSVQWQPPAARLYQVTDTVIPGDRHGYIRRQTCRQCAVMQFDVSVQWQPPAARLYQGTDTVISGDRHVYMTDMQAMCSNAVGCGFIQ